ncbi:MAG TPA: DUF1990 domain-containing protein [Propionibacteriaceae bacterium]|nr:DUF1990 domain-containing protein [Propionibacteriaceae bacterium]
MSALLPQREVERLRRQDLTYLEVGRTRGQLPPGYAQLSRRARIGTGQDEFQAAAQALLGWRLQRGAGVRVRPSSPTVAEDAVAVLLLGVGPLAVRAPVRVVYVLDEPRRVGFAYGTLPGHPESGEEAFLVELADDGTVTCQITAFSRPDTWLTKVGAPLATLAQRWVTTRYLRSLAV